MFSNQCWESDSVMTALTGKPCLRHKLVVGPATFGWIRIVHLALVDTEPQCAASVTETPRSLAVFALDRRNHSENDRYHALPECAFAGLGSRASLNVENAAALALRILGALLHSRMSILGNVCLQRETVSYYRHGLPFGEDLYIGYRTRSTNDLNRAQLVDNT